MRSFWLVARHEFRRTALQRSFLLLTLAVPLGMAAIIALALLMEKSGQSSTPLGYVDQAGVLDPAVQAGLPDPDERIPILSFPDEAAAEAALRAGDIQAFFTLPPGYPASLNTRLTYLERPPGSDAWGQFDDFVRASLVASYPEASRTRLLEGSHVTVRDVGSGRTFSEESPFAIALPLIVAVLFFFAISFASGFMLQVVADEKENRTMEVIVTTITPTQLIGGKALGLVAASLTQLAVYLAAGTLAILIARPHVAQLQAIRVPWDSLALMTAFFLPSYALVAALMIAIGSAVTQVQQGQQVGGLFALLFAVPLFFTPILFQDPGHPLMVLFTLFPLTSFLTVGLRWGLGSVPWWQIGLGWALLVAAAAGALWSAARIFRAGMLVYGQPLNLRALAAAVRGE